jgi:ABC-type polysaccharide/polyol phosphate export permease
MSQTAVKHTSVSAKNKKQFLRQSRNRKENITEAKHRFNTEEDLIDKQIITPEDVINLPTITKGFNHLFQYIFIFNNLLFLFFIN